MTRLTALSRRYSDLAEPLRSERRIELAVLVAAVVIALQLLWLGAASLRDLRVDPVVPAADSLRVAELKAAPGIRAEDSLVLRSRPLFWSSRRPVAAAAVADYEEKAAVDDGNLQPAPALKSISLSGIYGGGAYGGAILLYQGKRLRVAVGEELDGWELESVAPNAAVFVSAGKRETYELVERPIAAVDSGQGNDPLAEREAAVRARALEAAVEQQAANNAEPTLTLGGR